MRPCLASICHDLVIHAVQFAPHVWASVAVWRYRASGTRYSAYAAQFQELEITRQATLTKALDRVPHYDRTGYTNKR